MYDVLSIYGKNVLTTEDEAHRRHRKICAPAFSESNNALVWEETLAVTNDWFKDLDKRSLSQGGEAVTEDMVKVTLQAALHIISSAAFGMKLEWSGNLAPARGHKLNFRDALSNVLDYLFFKILIPSVSLQSKIKCIHTRILTIHFFVQWAYGKPWPSVIRKALDDTQLAHDELDQYLDELIQSRQDGSADNSKKDLLSLLVASAQEEEGSKAAKLPVQDIKGNIYSDFPYPLLFLL